MTTLPGGDWHGSTPYNIYGIWESGSNTYGTWVSRGNWSAGGYKFYAGQP
ncbi:MAG TPA: hypothetical protein VN734_10965 [Acidobacteriaceae bacterium]|nr:hypothetical protein [Acidobacteriaceae bacterium]